jgi:hypothetical protein
MESLSIDDDLAGSLDRSQLSLPCLEPESAGIAISAYFFSVLIVGGNTMQKSDRNSYSLVDYYSGNDCCFCDYPNCI